MNCFQFFFDKIFWSHFDSHFFDISVTLKSQGKQMIRTVRLGSILARLG